MQADLSLLLFSVGLLNLLIGAYVYWKNPRASTHIAFGLMALTTGLWSFGVALGHYGPFHLWGARLSMAVGGLIPLTALIFVERFPAGYRAKFSLIFAPIAIPLSCLSLTPLILVKVSAAEYGYRGTYGRLYLLYSIYVLVCFGLSLFLLGKKYRDAIGSLKLQTKYLFLGLAIPIVAGTITNLLVPLIFGSSEQGRYGPLVSLVMIVTVAHAIIRHRLMDIRVVVKRGAVYLSAFGVAGALLAALIVGSNTLIHEDHRGPLRDVAFALVVGLFFFPLKGLIQRAFDRYLYREPYDYRRTIQQASRALSGTIQLPALLGHVHAAVGETLRPEGQAIFLLEEEDHVFQRASTWGQLAFPESVAARTPLLERATRMGTPVFRDELTSEETALAAEYTHLGSEVVVPFIEDSRLIGFLAVGPKRSGDPFFSDDADLLGTLAHQSSVAIRNAQAHRLVLEANEYIQKVVATIDSGVISVNARGRVKVFNRAAEAMTGTPADSLRGHPVAHLPGPLARLVQSTLDNSQPHSQAELTLPDAAGQLIPLMCSTSPLWDGDGSLVGAVAVFSDLSRLKELELEKRRAERLAALEAIASGMAHEIRNPLVAIKTFLQLLPHALQRPGLSARPSTPRDRSRHHTDRGAARSVPHAGQRLVTAHGAAGRLDRARAHLRSVARADGGTADPSPLRRRRHDAAHPRECISVGTAFLEPVLKCDRGHGTRRRANGAPGRPLRRGGTTLLIEVSDTGPGVADDVLPNIFNPFVTTKPRGSGLGLAICRSVADAHHAKLAARNNTERSGATFTVEFPVLAKEPTRTSP